MIAPLAPGETLPDRFSHVARLHGPRPALRSFDAAYADQDLTYGQLSAGTASWSRAIAARGGAPGDRVAILMRHDIHQAAALLSVVEAGRIVVVLNPTDTAIRLRQILEDAAPALLIADAGNLSLAETVMQGIGPHVSWDDIKAATTLAAPPPLDADAAAFIVYTSGSVGRPKGVVISHQQAMHNALRLASVMRLGTEDRIALLPSLSGLHGVTNLLCALLRGASLHPFPVMERGVAGLAGWMVERRITAFSASTSLFRGFIQTLEPGQQLAPVRVVRIGGEQATSNDVALFQDHFVPNAMLVNTLASSEAGNIAYLLVTGRDAVPEGPLAVGRPFEGMSLQIVDPAGHSAAAGEPGEIVVGSRHLTHGYWRDQALTSARFSHDASGVPTFHSGDWGRINADGILEFLGRRDTRVKVHGSRVDLGDVEYAISLVAGVERVAVCPFEGRYGTQLAAYVVPRAGAAVTSGRLRRATRERLPWFMLPSIFRLVDDLPLMAHGKIDRAKLTEAMPPTSGELPNTDFQGETETLIASIWTEAFGLQAIGRSDNFFELGGDSLIASVIAALIHDETGAELNLDSFTLYSTVADQAAHVDNVRHVETTQFDLARADGRTAFPLSFEQQRIWNYARPEGGGADYTVLARYRITGPLDLETLRTCMGRLVDRHELLRTTFHAGDHGPVQTVHPSGDVALTFVDATADADPAAAVDAQIEILAASKMALDRLPLVRFTLIKTASDDHQLLRFSHHILHDGFAWTLYFNQLADLYAVERGGLACAAAGTNRPQYGDYAVWQRHHFSAEAPACQRLIGWWRTVMDTPAVPTQWPALRLQPAPAAPSDGSLLAGLDKDVWDGMAALAAQQRVTVFAAWLSALSAFLGVQAGDGETIIGTYVSNRKRAPLQSTFGDFSNLVTLRLACRSGQTFRSWLVTARDHLAAAAAHSEVPYEELRRVLAQEGRPLPEIRTIVMLNADQPPVRFAGITISKEVMPERTMPWGFTARVKPQIMDCHFTFDASIYRPETVRAGVERWKGFVDAVSRNPDMTIAQALMQSGLSSHHPAGRSDGGPVA